MRNDVISNIDDIINSDTICVGKIHDYMDYLRDEIKENNDVDLIDELRILENSDVDTIDRHTTLISEDSFEQDIDNMLREMYNIPRSVILDMEANVNIYKSDYQAIEIDGVTFYYR